MFSYLPDTTAAVSVKQCDLLIACCGFEDRSSYLTRQWSGGASRVVSYSYSENRVLSYAANLEFFTSVGSVYNPIDLPDFVRHLEEQIGGSLKEAGLARIVVDVSSFDRERMAHIVSSLHRLSRSQSFQVSFLYAVATFDSHLAEQSGAVLRNGPLSGFEGWTSRPSLPVACVIGLGFENLLALAALETLEPARTIAFLADSDDNRFQQRVRSDNEQLLRPSEVAVLPYRLEDPFSTLHDVEAIFHALRRNYRIVIVPLGPKLFALLALLLAVEYEDEVTVWRVSADQGGEPEDRAATGQVIELQVHACPA